MRRRIAHAFRNGYSIGCVWIFVVLGVFLGAALR